MTSRQLSPRQLSPRAGQLARSLARTLELLREHDKINPAEVDTLYAQILVHIRSARPHVLVEPGALP